MSIFNEARQQTWNEVKGLSDHEFNQKPSAEEWSVREVLDHLKKIDETAHTLLSEQAMEAPLKETEEKPLEMAEDRTNKRTAPPHLAPEQERKSIVEMKEELDVARQHLTAVIASLKEEDFERVLPHPVFQELTIRQWIDFIGHHEKRHINQIEEIKQKIERV
ncbi:DinB family protein [Bacillus nakamurai]|uniref:DinB family protein n=1 Tax=Bacillus nakamurai TaxID=1793963 RepID=UPI001E5E5EFD|nr:DinB family protein [Bacillus nakamurai]MCC9024205.1 DinB family protein [Bacillus nakamurai]